MSDSKYEFATSILTSKTPLQAAAILPHTLNSSQDLVQNRLIAWFQRYSSEIQRHNHALGELLSEGAGILGYGPPPKSPTSATSSQPPSKNKRGDVAPGAPPKPNPDDLGSFNKVWNTFLRLIELEVHSNEQFFKNIKLETLSPLKDFVSNDVRYSELVLNSQELQEIARGLSTGGSNNSEYQWNVKAPQIFDNLENFEKIKSQLLFDVILAYFNSSNTKFSKLVGNSENSVNYLLGTYKLDDEMNLYLQYLLKSDFSLELSIPPPPPPSQKHQEKRLSSFAKLGGNNSNNGHANHDLASTYSSASGTSGSKKPSKLKSKVGSIFGRKKNKKASAGTTMDGTIQETESITSSLIQPGATRSTRNRSFDSLGNALVGQPPAHASGVRRESDLYQSRQKETGTSSAPITTPVPASQPQQPVVAQAPAQDDAPLPPAKPLSSTSVPLTPKPKQVNAIPPVTDSPNVIKYDSSSSSSSEEAEEGRANENRKSLLQQHDLDHQPIGSAVLPPTSTFQPVHREHLSESTTATVGKFSFEAGDDERPISTTPKEQQRNVFEEPSAFLNDPQTSNSFVSDVPNSQNGNTVPTTSTLAPPPPPSRKAHSTAATPFKDNQSVASSDLSNVQSLHSSNTGSRNRKDIKSQYFHNLPNARDSVIAPRKLSKQDTGNSSILRHLNGSSGDIFKHGEEQYQVGLNASIAEVINASFKDDKLVRRQLLGEIAFNYKPDPSNPLNELELEKFPIVIQTNFEKVNLNNQFVSRNPNFDDVYLVDPQYIVSKTLGGLKYLKTLDQVPVFIHQAWKFEDHQASVILNLKLNSQYLELLTLDNVIISVALSNSVQTTSASSKPSGTFNKDLNRITWRLTSPITLSADKGEQLIARFMTNGKGSEHESGIQLKFSVLNPPKSTELFLNGIEVPSIRSLVSGSYSGHI